MTFESMIENTPVAPSSTDNVKENPIVNEETLAVKVSYGDDIRRATFNETTYVALRDLSAKLFELDPATTVLKYQDEEGDNITVVCETHAPAYHSFFILLTQLQSSDGEMLDALQVAKGKKILRLFVDNKAPSAPQVATEGIYLFILSHAFVHLLQMCYSLTSLPLVIFLWLRSLIFLQIRELPLMPFLAEHACLEAPSPCEVGSTIVVDPSCMAFLVVVTMLSHITPSLTQGDKMLFSTPTLTLTTPILMETFLTLEDNTAFLDISLLPLSKSISNLLSQEAQPPTTTPLTYSPMESSLLPMPCLVVPATTAPMLVVPWRSTRRPWRNKSAQWRLMPLPMRTSKPSRT